jgi:hypothetical protein
MKKGLIALFIISIFFPCIANATYHLNSFAVNNRIFEDGNQFNRLTFEVVDNKSQYPSTDVMGSITLTDPNGQNLVVTVKYESYFAIQGIVNLNNGMTTTYQPEFFYSYYSTDFSYQLVTGIYKLTFTDKDGEVSNKNFTFNGIVNPPLFPSNSYNYYFDKDGNFFWRWQQMPSLMDPNMYSIKASIVVYDKLENFIGEVFAFIPTNIEQMFVPKETFNMVLSRGTLKLQTQVRTKDNNNRAYSSEVPINISQIPTGTACTATLNANFLIQVPNLYYNNGTMTLSADFDYAPNPTYPTLIPFKLTNASVLNNPSFSCTASTLSSDLTIHIPDVLFPDGTTHLWVDLAYNAALSIDGNFYWVVSNYGAVSN